VNNGPEGARRGSVRSASPNQRDALCQTRGKTGLPTLEPIRTESATVSR
jgi:hypothetical protein